LKGHEFSVGEFHVKVISGGVSRLGESLRWAVVKSAFKGEEVASCGHEVRFVEGSGRIRSERKGPLGGWGTVLGG